MSNQETLDPGALFAEFERDGFYLREPRSDLTGLVSAVAVGDCLAPVIVADDLVFFDPAEEPRHNDLCALAWHPGMVEEFSQSVVGHEWEEQWQSVALPRAIKLLRKFPATLPHGMEHLADEFQVSNTGAGRVKGRCDILGRVVAVYRNGAPISHGDLVFRAASTSNLDQNAATSIIASTVTMIDVGNASHGVTEIASVTVGPFGTPSTVVVTVSGTWSTSGSTAGVVEFRISTTPSSPFGGGAPEVEVTAGATDNGVMNIEYTFAQLQNVTQTYYLIGSALPSGATFGYTVTQCSLKAEAIKV